ncbi:site-specific integrase [Cryobacterium sinapicolor]|uniref:Site-specific integrase n=1 Tax=Cryobacterium sinapicolor TaxID=1259236 RepID=A0ABY2IYZ2_9MICO|nr:site-specific integrase [Cryobacterium sinapicolor]TFC96216.1 site-specific integrase [Cryobacterium sinapicolor]
MAKRTSRTRRRGKGALYTYQTKAGTKWRWQLYVPVDPEQPDGETRRTGAGGFASMEDADDALRDAIKRMQSQQVVSTTGSPTVAVYAQQWLTGLQLEASTIQGYAKIVRNHIVPKLGQIRVDKLTATRIARHYQELLESGRRDCGHSGEPLSANSVNKVHIVLGSILDAAVDDGLLLINLARKKRTVKAPTGKQIRAQRPEIVTWDATELRTFLVWNRDTFHDELHPLWLTIANTGMRRSEALAIRWGDIDMKNHRISIRRAADVTARNVVKLTKTGGARVVDIDLDTESVLRSYKATRGSLSLDLARSESYVFANDAGWIRSPNEVGRRWSNRMASARKALGEDVLKRVTLKGLRHTHATLLLELGIHPKVVQERLGHSNIATTMNIYSHVTPTMQKDAVSRLHDLIAGT